MIGQQGTAAPLAGPVAPRRGRRDDPRTWPNGAGGTMGQPKLVVVPTDGSEQQAVEPLVVMRGRWISLRTLVPDDLKYLSTWCEDPFLEQMVGSEFLHAYKHQYDKHPSFYEAVLSDPTQAVLMIEANRGWDHPVGVIRLFNIHVREGYASIESIVGDTRASRRGYGVMASRMIAFYGVDTFGLRRIECRAYEYNYLSVNTLRRNGFTQEGVLRKAAFKDGRYWDIIIFGILGDEIEEERRKDKYLLPAGRGDGKISDSS